MVSGRLATHVILIISAFIIPAILGTENYGHYAAVMAVIAILQTLSTAGLNLVQVRFLAPLWQLGPRDDAVVLGSTIWTARMFLALVAGLLAAIWFAVSGDLVSGFAVLVSLSVLAVIRSILDLSAGFFLALGRAGVLVALDLTRALLVLIVVPLAFQLAGMAGVFILLPVLIAIPCVIAATQLVRRYPFRPRHFQWRALRSNLGFSLASLTGVFSHMVQVQISIYVVAIFVARSEAGILALTLQIFAFLQGLFQSGRTSLMPILLELETRGEISRLRLWGGTIMRYGAALSCLACVVWALLGGFLISSLLPFGFGPVHGSATVILFAVAFFCCGATCNGLLFIRGRPWLGASSCVLYMVITVAGVLLLMTWDEAIAQHICWVYVLAAAIFFASSYVLLGCSTGLWLPLRRTLQLLLPMAVAWPAVIWQGSFGSALIAAAGFVLLYAVAAAGIGLLPVREAREIIQAVRGSRQTR
jgi:O-antigen/teichoic acid export membrane protein